MAEQIQKAITRMKHVGAYVGVGQSTIYSWLDPKSPQYDPTFPRPTKLGPRASGIRTSLLDEWIEKRSRKSEAA